MCACENTAKEKHYTVCYDYEFKYVAQMLNMYNEKVMKCMCKLNMFLRESFVTFIALLLFSRLIQEIFVVLIYLF